MILTVAKQDFEVSYAEDLSDPAFHQFMYEDPEFITFDTETTGLHIKKDYPFLAAICFNNKVIVFPARKDLLVELWYWSKNTKRIYAHNTTYDMHMVANIMGDSFPYEIENWADSMCLSRLIFEAKSPRHGGDRISLKHIGKKYFDSKADQWEKAVKSWLKARETQNRKVLTGVLHGIKDDKGKWTLKRLNAALNDGTERIPRDVMIAYQDWRHHYPKPTYQDVPMDIMMPYVATDVILTKILVDKAWPVIEHRNLVGVFERESRLLRTVYKMERSGIKVDRNYLEECNKKLDDYIKDLYTELHIQTGMKFTVGQHAVIKKMYTEFLGKEPPSTDKKFLKKRIAKGDRTAEIINRLRRLEKWKETYIERILENSSYDGRYYSQLNQFNPVSGRFSGDAQQFPKDPIIDEDEVELYHPRKAFIGNIYYLDYSQVELRVQGHYTIHYGGDTNLCRAYMPFKCKHYKTGEEFDHTTASGRKRWLELKEGSPADLHWEDTLKQKLSAWIIPETGETWIPTDVHMATTLKALVAMGKDPEEMSKEDLKWWRSKGKTFNFMRNYGGGDAMAAETLEIELEQATAMNKGYTDAFPLVVSYQNGVIATMRKNGFAVNMYGRRYELSDWNKHYTIGNHLIQGTCADMLKDKMIKIDDFLVQNNLQDKLRMILCVHDELQFEKTTKENMNWAIKEIQKIMEDAPDIYVPIVADVEVTETTWADKKVLLNLG